MDISKQMIDQKVRKLVSDNDPDYFSVDDEERNISRAFLLLGVSAYLGIDITEAAQYITDGGGRWRF